MGFAGENRDACRFTCEADKIDDWLAYGRPVVLICVNLRSQEAWWKRVDTWFADPVRRARRVVEFDKAADRFDPDGCSSLSARGVPAGQPLPWLDGSERLVSNLLALTGFAPVIRSASTPCRTRADAWERMGSNGAFESGFILSAGQIYTMCQVEDGPLAVLCDGPVTSAPSPEWSDTHDADQQRRFVPCSTSRCDPRTTPTWSGIPGRRSSTTRHRRTCRAGRSGDATAAARAASSSARTTARTTPPRSGTAASHSELPALRADSVLLPSRPGRARNAGPCRDDGHPMTSCRPI